MLTLEKVRVSQDGFDMAADLVLGAGQITALIGPSGAGKSTLLAAVAGFVQVASGRVLWDGSDITDLPPGNRPVSILFQDNNLFPHLTVSQNVGLGLRPSLRLSTDEKGRVEAALGRVGLAGFGGRKPGQLSGGQASRAALARVLVANRPLVLLDEPFAALGPGLREEMLDLVRDILIGAGKTVILVTHDPGDARRVAAETVLIWEGRAEGPYQTGPLFDDPPEALKTYLGQGR